MLASLIPRLSTLAAIYNPDHRLGFQAHLSTKSDCISEPLTFHSIPKPGYSDFPDPPVVSVIQSSWQASLSLTVNRFRQALASVDVHHAQGKQERSLYARIANGKVAAN